MKVAYVIGPLRASTIRQRIINIRAAEDVAVELWKAGFAVICQHLGNGLMSGIIPEQQFISGDLEIIPRCDFAVVCKGWEDSDGSRQEINCCRGRSVPFYFNVADAIKSE